jgi:hypothetical protein
MTKLLDYVDSAATKGARKQAIQSRASMLVTRYGKTSSAVGKVQIKTSYGAAGPKVTIRQKSGR